jgi:hypothetical protein
MAVICELTRVDLFIRQSNIFKYQVSVIPVSMYLIILNAEYNSLANIPKI